MNFKKIIKTISFSLITVCALSVSAQAASVQLLSYDGTGIWSWRSVNDFKLTAESSVVVNHKQTKDTAGDKTKLNVAVIKKNFIGTSNKANKDFTGNSSGTIKSTLDKGTYFLRFESSERAKKFNISGTVSK